MLWVSGMEASRKNVLAATDSSASFAQGTWGRRKQFHGGKRVSVMSGVGEEGDVHVFRESQDVDRLAEESESDDEGFLVREAKTPGGHIAPMRTSTKALPESMNT